MLIPRREKSAHWYTPGGEPIYEVPLLDGSGMRPTRITDAMKMGLFRSVTGVLSILGKEGLVNWRIEQGILSALTLPRRFEENEHDFAKRALADSEEQGRDAADKGTLIHDLAAEFLTKGKIPEDPKLAAILAPFMAWCASNVKRCIYSEKVVVNPVYCYAGKLDAFVELTRDAGYAIIDIKTQDMGRDTKGNLKPDFYPEWPMQLAAYKECEALQFWTPSNHKLISLVLNREEPGFAEKEWPASAAHFEAFAYCCGIWSYLKKCTPGLKAAA